MTDHDLMVWRFNNPKKTTAQLAAFLCMPRKVFEEAVRNGMKQEAAMEKEKRNETTDL